MWPTSRLLDLLRGEKRQNPYVTLRDEAYEYRFACNTKKERNRAERMFAKEAGTISWLAHELREDDVFFDVGANIGVYTIFGARRISKKGCVVAFEPHIPNADRLIENIFLNGQQEKIKLVTSAVSNYAHFANFNYQSVLPATSTSQFGANCYEGEVFSPQFVEVKHGCTLDELCDSGLLPIPNVVKIDIDGLDFEVLEGMRGLLTAEYPPRSIQAELGTDSKPKILDLFSEVGYELKNKHWTQAGLDHIGRGNDPESYPHYGIFAPKHVSSIKGELP